MSRGRKSLESFLKRIKRPMELEENTEYKLVTIKMNHKGVVLRGLKKGSEIKSKMFEVKQGDFILSGIDARNGAFGIVPAELDGAIVTNDFWYFEIDETVINKELFLELTSTNWFDEICKRGSDGTTQRIRLQKDKFFNQSIHLPQPTEQQGLLKKIQTIRADQVILHKQTIDQQIQVKQLKQAILQEAIQGKLTEQWRIENGQLKIEPASKLLKRIQVEKQKLIDEKKIRKEKPLPAISAEEMPFDLPDGWVWCRVGQLGVINRGKSPKYNKEGENIILNQKCVRWFHVETQHCKTISLDWYETFPDEIKTAVNDILINSTGEGTIGRSAIVDENSAGLLFDSHVLRFRTTIESPYIMTLINSDFGQNQINDLKGAKSTKQTELGVNNLSNMIFPLAPMLEQKKLVQKVEALMQTCTDLEAQIKQSETHATQLMQAVIKEAFEAEKAIAKP